MESSPFYVVVVWEPPSDNAEAADAAVMKVLGRYTHGLVTSRSALVGQTAYVSDLQSDLYAVLRYVRDEELGGSLAFAVSPPIPATAVWMGWLDESWSRINELTAPHIAAALAATAAVDTPPVADTATEEAAP